MKDEVSKREGKRTVQNSGEVSKNKSSSDDIGWRNNCDDKE